MTIPHGAKQKQTENTRRMLHELKEKRKQKLLIYLAYDKPLPAADARRGRSFI